MKKIKICALTLGMCVALGALPGCDKTEETGVSVVSSSETVTSEMSSSSSDTSASSESSESSAADEPEVTVDLSDVSDQEYANTFITNFVEVFFPDYDRSTATPEQVLNFVHIHLKLNSRSAISYENVGDACYETFTVEKAQSVVGRYFAYLLTEESCEALPNPPSSYSGSGPFYQRGKICYPAADGESYNLIGIVDSITNNPEGTATIKFTIYSIDLNTYNNLDANGIRAYYKLTPAQAAADGTLTAVTTGTAVADIGQSGSYHLISYSTVK